LKINSKQINKKHNNLGRAYLLHSIVICNALIYILIELFICSNGVHTKSPVTSFYSPLPSRHRGSI